MADVKRFNMVFRDGSGRMAESHLGQYVLHSDYESLQSQLAAMTERSGLLQISLDSRNTLLTSCEAALERETKRADGLQAVVDAARAVLTRRATDSYSCKVLVGDILQVLSGGYMPVQREAPVPAQPVAVPKHAADWFHDMREVLFDVATSDVISDRAGQPFVTVAIDRNTLDRAAILSTTEGRKS